jgi:hypothetical protein
MREPAAVLVLTSLLLVGCGSTPDGPDEPNNARMRQFHKRFIGGEEYQRASLYRLDAIGHHRQAFLTQDPIEKDGFLREAYEACQAAQAEYEQAIRVYPYHQREFILSEMDAVHGLMLEILRDRP